MRGGRAAAGAQGRVPQRFGREGALSASLGVEFEQAGEDFFVGEGGIEAVGRGDGRVELCVRVREPRGALVVEVGQGAAREDVLISL